MNNDLPSFTSIKSTFTKGDQKTDSGTQEKEIAQSLHRNPSTTDNVKKATTLAYKLGIVEKPDGSTAFSIVDSDSPDPEKSPKNEITVTAGEIQEAVSHPLAPPIPEHLNTERDAILKQKFAKHLSEKWISLGGDLGAVANLENQEWWNRVYPVLASIFPVVKAKVDAGIDQASINLSEDIPVQMAVSSVFKNVFRYHEKTGKPLDWIFLNKRSAFRIDPQNRAQNPNMFAMGTENFDEWLATQFDEEMLGEFEEVR